MSGRHGMIDWFAGRMQAKIEARGYHGKLPQTGLSYEWFLLRLNVELGELAEAMFLARLEEHNPAKFGLGTPIDEQLESIIDECADVANFAMQIADKATRERDSKAAR